MFERTLGPDHPTTLQLNTASRHGFVLLIGKLKDKAAEAEALLQKTLSTQQRVLRLGQPDTQQTTRHLQQLQQTQNRRECLSFLGGCFGVRSRR